MTNGDGVDKAIQFCQIFSVGEIPKLGEEAQEWKNEGWS